MMIEFFVIGRPATAGSKQGFYNKKTKKVIIAPASKFQKPWMEAVKWAAIQEGFNGKVLLEGPLSLSLCFYLNRPKGHFKKSGGLTKSALLYPTTRPDSIKLARAVEDALTGLIYRDDSQIVEHYIYKWYSGADSPVQGVNVRIRELGT